MPPGPPQTGTYQIYLRVILPPLLALGLIVAAIFWWVPPFVEQVLMDRKRELLRELTVSATGILEEHEALVRDGSLPLDESQRQAAAHIRALRYGDERKDYFWVITADHLCIVNPFSRHLEGRDIADLTDREGSPFIREFVDVASRDGQGFVEYSWQWKDHPERIERKLSYVQLFEPWGWVIGTGVYLADVRVQIRGMSHRLGLTFLVVGALMLVGLLYVSTQWARVERRRRAAVAELQTAHDRLERQNEELRALDRIKDGLIRDVSHELKTPVAKQAMQLEMLRTRFQRQEASPEVARVLEVMDLSIQRQRRIINNLLDLSRLEAGGRAYARTPLRLDTVVRDALDGYREAAALHEIELVEALTPVELKSDAEMLWHVFSNLLHNAIKFRRPDGPNRIAVSIDEGESAEDEVRVRIEDAGVGLSAEVQGLVFEKFYQASATAEGFGVGLSICRGIVEGLGGRIWLESAGAGSGTTATVALPRT